MWLCPIFNTTFWEHRVLQTGCVAILKIYGEGSLMHMAHWIKVKLVEGGLYLMGPNDRDSHSPKCYCLSIFFFRDLSLSQRRCWKLKTAGIWRCVDRQLFPDTTKDCSATKMKAVQSLEESRTSCRMTHRIKDDIRLYVVLQSDSGLDSLELLRYFVLMVGAAATVVVVVAAAVIVVVPYTFSPYMSSILTQKLLSRWVFALVELSLFLTICLLLKLLHILMCRKYFYYCLKIHIIIVYYYFAIQRTYEQTIFKTARQCWV